MTETAFQRVKSQAASARTRAGKPEDSVRIRLVVLATVLVAVAAVIAQGAVPSTTAAGSLILIPVGFAFSHYRRGERNILLKLFLAVALLMALGRFLNSVRYVQSVDEARVALASLFLWVQVIHSFDLPRLRDLAFSVSASVVLMAEAGSLSLDMKFGLFLIPFACLAAWWLYLSQRSVAERAADQSVARVSLSAGGGGEPGKFPLKMITTAAMVALVSGGLVFISVPRMPGSRVVAPPFSLSLGLPITGFTGQVVNPGIDPKAAPPDSVLPYFEDAYPGFGSSVDLRARGHLSDDVVMKVRSAQAAFWRGQAYDIFDGTRWTASDETTRSIAGNTPWQIPASLSDPSTFVPSERLTQTFFVQKEQPNIAFAAYRPEELYFPAANAQVDDYGSIRTPILLDSGLIYSVVSDVPQTTPRMLREAQGGWPSDFSARYTQLPETLPQRVIDLARSITDDQPTLYDKVLAVQAWLKTNTKYNLDISPDPPGVDSVDYFLFDRKQGFCEHIASAMTVMLRAVGIPSRFAVGFDSGERNPFTGYFEVKASDAHSWVEVFYPGIGWIEYDPTHLVPPADPGFGATFIAPQVFAAVGHFLSKITPAPVKHALAQAWSGVTAAARWAVNSWLLVLGLAVCAALAARFGGRLRRRSHQARLKGAAAAFASACETFASRGHPRPPQRTPSEHFRDLLAQDELARSSSEELELIIRTIERDGFAREKPAASQVDGSLEAARRLRSLARR